MIGIPCLLKSYEKRKFSLITVEDFFIRSNLMLFIWEYEI
jgi:hypothetical protein